MSPAIAERGTKQACSRLHAIKTGTPPLHQRYSYLVPTYLLTQHILIPTFVLAGLLPDCLIGCFALAQVVSAAPHEVLFVESEENLYLLDVAQQFEGHKFVSLGAAKVEGDSEAGAGGHGAEATFQQWLTDTIRAAGQTEGGTKIESAGAGAKVDAGVMLVEGKLRFDMAHPLVQQLSAQRALAPEVASAVAAQMFDNARLVAGVLPDSRTMLPIRCLRGSC